MEPNSHDSGYSSEIEGLNEQQTDQNVSKPVASSSTEGAEKNCIDLAIVGKGTSALTYLYARSRSAENPLPSKTVVFGDTGLWRKFEDSENNNFKMGQPHEFLYTLNLWNERKPQERGGKDYMKVSDYAKSLNKLENKLEKERGNSIFSLGYVKDIYYSSSDEQGSPSSQDYPYCLKIKVESSEEEAPKEVSYYAKEVIVATGLPLEKEHGDLKKNLKLKTTSESSSGGTNSSKTAKYAGRNYSVLENGSDYVNKQDMIFYEEQPKPFKIAVDGSGPVAAWAVEQALSNGITDIKWISKYDFKRATAWGRNAKIIQNAAKQGILYIGKITSIKWLEKTEDEESVQLIVEPIDEDKRKQFFIETIRGILVKKLELEIPRDSNTDESTAIKIMPKENAAHTLDVNTAHVQPGLFGLQGQDKIPLNIQVPKNGIKVTKEEFQKELFYQLTEIEPDDRFGTPKINFIEKSEEYTIHKYINAPGPDEKKNVLNFLSDEIKKNIEVIEDECKRIISDKDIKGITGLQDKKHEGKLKIIGPAAYRYMRQLSDGDSTMQSRKYQKHVKNYEKLQYLFSQTNNTLDGIAVTRAAIKVLTDFKEFPTKSDLELKETEKSLIGKLVKVFKVILQDDENLEKAETAAKHFWFFNWNTTDLLETRMYFKKIFGWNEVQAEKAAYKFIFGRPQSIEKGIETEKFLEARDDKIFGFNQEDLIGLNEEEVENFSTESTESSESRKLKIKIKGSVLYKLRKKIEEKKN